jgi:hypothetical protein
MNDPPNSPARRQGGSQGDVYAMQFWMPPTCIDPAGCEGVIGAQRAYRPKQGRLRLSRRELEAAEQLTLVLHCEARRDGGWRLRSA